MANVPFTTVLGLFVDHTLTDAERTALRVKHGDSWDSVTWGEYGTFVDEVGHGLLDLGVKPGDRVAILSANRAEWHVADLATMSVGAVTVPLYPNAASEQLVYLLNHSKSRACFVEGSRQVARIIEHVADLPLLEWILLIDSSSETSETSETSEAVPATRPSTIAYDALRARGRAQVEREPNLLGERRGSLQPSDVATIVYTSGTTGPPRGAMLTHANLTATVEMISSVLPLSTDDRFLSFLPLSHIAERIVSHIGQIVSGGETWFARDLSTVAGDLLDCRPTVFFAVPRVWEKMRDVLAARLRSMPSPVAGLVGHERAVVSRIKADRAGGVEPALTDRVQEVLFDATLGYGVRRAVGLDHARLLLSGAAPIDDALVTWLHGVGLPVGQVYGQTEVCGPTSISRPGHIRIGTVGQPLPGEEVVIAEDGEVLVRGANVFAGYVDDPEKTAEALDTDGWLHTGDLGRFDPDGELRIVGRKKDLIATSQGKKIAPQELENRLRADRFISQAVLFGEGKPYLVALITVDADAVADWAVPGGKPLATEALASDPDVLREIADAVRKVNESFSSAEQIKKWAVLTRDFTVDAGELTPTLKVVRRIVAANFADHLEALYAESGEVA